MKKQNGNAAVFFLVGLAALVAGAMYLKIQEFASWIGVDFDSAMRIIKAMMIFVLAFGVCVWLQMTRKTYKFMPAAIFICSIPVLDFHSWGYLLPESKPSLFNVVKTSDLIAMNSEPAWYGVWWWQGLIIAALVGVGWAADRWLFGDDRY